MRVFFTLFPVTGHTMRPVLGYELDYKSIKRRRVVEKTIVTIFFIPFLMRGPTMRPVLGSSLRTGPVVSDSALARAVLQHTDTSKHTKAALTLCYALHSIPSALITLHNSIHLTEMEINPPKSAE